MEIGKLFNIFAAEAPQIQDTSQDYIKYTVGFVCVCASLLFVAYKFFQHRSAQPIAAPLNEKTTPSSPVTQRITAASPFVAKLASGCINANLKDVKECIETHNVSLNCLGNKSTLLIAVCVNCSSEKESEYKEVAAYLISKGVMVNQVDDTGSTALLYTARYGFNELTKLLIENSADVNFVRSYTSKGIVEDDDNKKIIETPLFLAVLYGHSKVVETLLLTPAAVLDEAFKDESLLHIAAGKGNPVMVALLIDQGGFNPDIRNSNQLTPLHIAAEKGFELVIRVLLGKKASIDAQTTNKKTPLFCAAEKGHSEAVRCLIENGADIQLETKNMSPLHIAAMNGHTDVIKAFLESGKEINLDIVNELNQTPLHCASLAGQTEVVKFLIENGASKEAKDTKRRTPSELAKDDSTRKIIGTTKKMTPKELANRQGFADKQSLLRTVLSPLIKKT